MISPSTPSDRPPPSGSLPRWRIEAGIADDVDALAAFVNRAYRGVAAKEGWTHEANLLDGQRTDATMLAADLAAGAAILVMRAVDDDAILACVATRLDAGADCTQTLHFGMLSVDPRWQGRGIGRRMVEAVEERALAQRCTAVTMTVIHTRETLIAWYARLGYRPNGDTEPFPYGDARYGEPRTGDLWFVVLKKVLTPDAPQATPQS